MSPTDPPPLPPSKAGTRPHKVLAALTAAAVVITAIGDGAGSVARLGPAQAANPAGTSGARATLPVVYAQVEGWHGGQVRPAALYVGQGGSPYVNALKWLSWTATGAQANGYLHMQKPGCALPTYQCPYQRFSVKVQLSGVEAHNGVRYYSRMRWTYIKNHVPHVILWKTDKGYWRSWSGAVGQVLGGGCHVGVTDRR